MKIVATLALAAIALTSAFAGPETLKGKAIPTFTMKSVTGKSYTNKSLKGKVVVLDFWATWCAPCVAASPTMQKLYAKYADKGLVVLGSNITDTVAGVKAYAKKHGYTYPFTQGNEAFAKSLGISSIPVFMFIDKKGVVQKVDTGFNAETSPAEWEATITKLLATK